MHSLYPSTLTIVAWLATTSRRSNGASSPRGSRSSARLSSSPLPPDSAPGRPGDGCRQVTDDMAAELLDEIAETAPVSANRTQSVKAFENDISDLLPEIENVRSTLRLRYQAFATRSGEHRRWTTQGGTCHQIETLQRWFAPCRRTLRWFGSDFLDDHPACNSSKSHHPC
jgi:hypothetical protein